MSKLLKSGLRFCVTSLLGLLLSVALGVGICYFGGDHACRNFIWPAVLILGSGFEGQLVALAATLLFLAVPFALAMWFSLGKWGPLK
jgi:hypothetical protein